MPTTSWELRLRALTIFVSGEGREPSLRASTPGEHRLALWLDEQRKAARAGRLDGARVEQLRSAGLLALEEGNADQRTGAAWLKVASIAEFLEEESRLPSLTSPASAGEKRLAAWMHAQLAGRTSTTEPAAALRGILEAAGNRDSRAFAHVG